MTLLVLFVFSSVVMVAGAMLAPAWPTAQPRIALNAALALGVVLGGAIFWAMLFGWNTLVIDYLLFALITVIFLGGTLSYGQRRAEKRGAELLDQDQGWPGPGDLAFFALVAFIFALPTLIFPVPLGTDAQGFGYLGLMVKLGGGFRTLTPWQPEIEYLYAPGFPLLIAYLSQQLGVGLHTVQVAVGGVLSLILVWLAYDFGSEVQGKPLGRAMAVAMLLGTGLFTAFMDSHLTTLLGMVFALACLTYGLCPGLPDLHRALPATSPDRGSGRCRLDAGRAGAGTPGYHHHPGVGAGPLAAAHVAGAAQTAVQTLADAGVCR